MKGALGGSDRRPGNRPAGGRQPEGEDGRGPLGAVTRERLDNGLSVVVAPMPHLHSAVATLFPAA